MIGKKNDNITSDRKENLGILEDTYAIYKVDTVAFEATLTIIKNVYGNTEASTKKTEREEKLTC